MFRKRRNQKTVRSKEARSPARRLSVEGLEDRLAPAGLDLDLGFALRAGAVNSDVGRAVTVDAAGNNYVTGYFQGTVQFDPAGSSAGLQSSAGAFTDAAFIAKYDFAGQFVWARSFGLGGGAAGFGVAVDGSGNVLVAGRFFNQIDLNPGAAVANFSSAGGDDAFVVKLDSSGNFLWGRTIGGSGDDAALAVVVNAAGTAVVAGAFTGTLTVGALPALVPAASNSVADFVVRLDAAGNFGWATMVGGGSSYVGENSVALDGAGNAYVTGTYNGVFDLAAAGGSGTLSAVNNGDIYVASLDSGGRLRWAKSFAATAGNRAFGNAIAAANGYVSFTGTISGTVDFDPLTAAGSLTATASDAYVVQLDSAGNFGWAAQLQGSGNQRGNAITVDPAGNVYTTGELQFAADFDPGPGIETLGSSGSADVYLWGLDSSGNFLHGSALGAASGFDSGLGIAAGPGGTLTVTGHFESTVDFDPAATSFPLTSNGGSDVFLVKLLPPLAPVADFTIDVTSASPLTSVTFDASRSFHPGAPSQSIVLYEWDFESDGIFDATGSVVSHVFGQFGTFTVTLRVTDNNDPAFRAQRMAVVDVNRGNRAPVAHPGGPYAAVAGQPLTLDGGLSVDPDVAFGDQLVNYRWEITNLATAVRTTFNAATPQLLLSPAQTSLLGIGSFDVRLTVRDSFGLEAGARTPLTLQANRPPVAQLSLNGFLEGQDVVLDGSPSFDPDPGDRIVRYEWDINFDGVTDVDTSNAVLTLTWSDFQAFLATGQTRVDLGLRVTDQSGANHSITRSGFIDRQPFVTTPLPDLLRPPNAPADIIDLRLHFDDPEENPIRLTYTVDAINGTAGLVSASIDASTDVLRLTYAPNASGQVNVTIRATDTDGAFVLDTFRVTVGTPTTLVRVFTLDQASSSLVVSSDTTDDPVGPVGPLLLSGPENFSVQLGLVNGLATSIEVLDGSVLGRYDGSHGYFNDNDGYLDDLSLQDFRSGDYFLLDELGRFPLATSGPRLQFDAAGELAFQNGSNRIPFFETLDVNMQAGTSGSLADSGTELVLTIPVHFSYSVSGAGDSETLDVVGTLVLRSSVNSPPVVTAALPDVTVAWNSPDTVLDLRSHFNDVEDGAAGLTYTVDAVSGAAGLVNVSIDNATDQLRLAYVPGAVGQVEVTIRATDGALAFVVDTLQVTVGVPSFVLYTFTLDQASSNLLVNSDTTDDPVGPVGPLTLSGPENFSVRLGLVNGTATSIEVLDGSVFGAYGTHGYFNDNDGYLDDLSLQDFRSGDDLQLDPLGQFPLATAGPRLQFDAAGELAFQNGSNRVPYFETLDVNTQSGAQGSLADSGTELVLTIPVHFAYFVSGAGDSETLDLVGTLVLRSPQNPVPLLTTPLPDVAVNVNAADTVIDLRGYFDDADDGPAGLTYTVQSITGTAGLLAASVAANDVLTLDYAPGRAGQVDITIRATDSAGGFVQDTFRVTVTDTLPTLVAPIPDVAVNEDAADTVFSLRTYFDDLEDGPAGLTYTVQSITGTAGLLTASVATNDDLTLDYAPGRAGQVDITIRATDGAGGFVQDTFRVTVTDTLPTLVAPIPDVAVNEDAADTLISLRSYFDDLEDGPAGLTFTVRAVTGTPGLFTASINAATDELTLDFAANASGTGTVTIRAVDSAGSFVEDTFSVSVAAVNDAPVNTVPAGVNVYEAGAVFVTGIAVADVESSSLTVTLTASRGTLSVNTSVAGGVTAASVTGNGTASVTLTSTVSRINTTLASATGLSYRPQASFFGLDVLNVQTTDAAAGSDSDSIPVTVAAIQVYSSANVPLRIPASGTTGTIVSTLTIADSYSIADLNVLLDITHTWDSDLDVFLMGPDGTEVQLFAAAGDSGDNFTNTVLDDEALQPISAGAPPFTGNFRPAAPLSAFDGKNVRGAWSLRVEDTATGDSGFLNNWSLIVDPATAYASGNVPLRIPVTGTAGTITSNLTVNDSYLIRDAEVRLNLTHTYDADLAVTLIAPDGTRIQLFADEGDAGDNFTNTVLDDEAAQAIGSGSAPFTGRFRPAEPLSALDGLNPQGTWQLEIVDQVSGDSGMLNSWQLILEVDKGPEAPDLLATAFNVVEAAAQWGSTVSVQYTVRNQGNAVAGPFQLALFLSSNSTISGADVALVNVPLAGLAAGAASSGTVSVTLPGAPGLPPVNFTDPDSVFLGAIVDSGSTIPEADENNNANRGSLLDRDALTILGGGEVEPNNTPPLADPLPPTGVINATIGTVGDVDYFVIDITEAGHLTLSATQRNGSGLDARLGLHNVESLLVLDGMRIGGGGLLVHSDDRAPGNPDPLIRSYVLPGRYYAEVAASTLNPNQTGAYTLVSQFVADAANPYDPDTAFVSRLQVGTNPTSIIRADFNNDTVLDLATVNQGSSNVSVLVGIGDATFEAQRVFDAPDTPTELAALDYNQDGRTDLATLDRLVGRVAILLGIGDGTFSDTQSIRLPLGDPALAGLFRTPLAIPDQGTVQSTMVVPDALTIDDVDVILNIAHTFDGQLAAALVGPDGTRVQLLNGHGGAGDNFRFTMFNDQAAKSISAGTAPFPFEYRPVQPLAAFDGTNAAGNWTLEVTDAAGGDVGSLVNWSLIVNGDSFYSSFPLPFAYGDFNRDGYVDRVKLDAINNNGAAPFADRLELEVGVPVDTPTAVDLDKSPYGPLVQFLLGLPQFVPVSFFIEQSFYLEADKNYSNPTRATPQLADFNGDGATDILVVSREGDLLVRYGRPGQPDQFEPPMPINEILQGPGARAAVILEAAATRPSIAAIDLESDSPMPSWALSLSTWPAPRAS